MVIVLSLVAKFICILSIVVIDLQDLELFLTGWQNMGMGITTFVSQEVGLLDPFLVQIAMYVQQSRPSYRFRLCLFNWNHYRLLSSRDNWS